MTDQIDVIGTQTRYSYNDLGQKTQEIDGYGSGLSGTIDYSFDDNGNLLQEIDGAGNTSNFEFNAMGQATFSDEGTLVGTAESTFDSTTMAYDSAGNMTSKLDGDGRLETYGYNAVGQETSNVWHVPGRGRCQGRNDPQAFWPERQRRSRR